MSAEPISILRRCDRSKVAELRSRNEFFWADLALADGAPAADISAAFGISGAAAQKLEDFHAGGAPAHRMHVEDELIVSHSGVTQPPEAGDDEAGEDGSLHLSGSTCCFTVTF